MITGNKGEWGEFYAFLKLISDQRLDAAGPGLEKLKDVFYPIVKIIRTETEGTKSYELLDNKVSISNEAGEVSLVKSDDLKQKVKEVFKHISESSGSTFSINVAQELMERFQVRHLNAGNQFKEDITLQIHDSRTATVGSIAFSIKSFIGNAATLLNASGATNFIYKIEGLSGLDIDAINKIEGRSKVRDRLKAIIDHSANMEYFGLDSDVFKKNLIKCDSIMPEILSYMLLLFYQNKGTSLTELINAISHDNVKFLGRYELDRLDYEHKIENLLNNIALGMVPSKEWSGLMRAHGGYIIVKDDGELVGYHAHHADIFRRYLLDNTKFETASTSRHEFGSLYEEDGNVFLKLNLQIRFIK